MIATEIHTDDHRGTCSFRVYRSGEWRDCGKPATWESYRPPTRWSDLGPGWRFRCGRHITQDPRCWERRPIPVTA